MKKEASTEGGNFSKNPPLCPLTYFYLTHTLLQNLFSILLSFLSLLLAGALKLDLCLVQVRKNSPP